MPDPEPVDPGPSDPEPDPIPAEIEPAPAPAPSEQHQTTARQVLGQLPAGWRQHAPTQRAVDAVAAAVAAGWTYGTLLDRLIPTAPPSDGVRAPDGYLQHQLDRLPATPDRPVQVPHQRGGVEVDCPGHPYRPAAACRDCCADLLEYGYGRDRWRALADTPHAALVAIGA